MPPRARSRARSPSRAQSHLQHSDSAVAGNVEDGISAAALARILRDAALNVPGVAQIGAADVVGPSTYGRRGELVRGVRITRVSAGITVEIHVTAKLMPLQALAESVRSAVIHAAAGKLDLIQVDVVIDALEATT